jgi:hypothetical protein
LKANQHFEEHVASIFSVEEYAKQETIKKAGGKSVDFQQTIRHYIPEFFVTTAVRTSNPPSFEQLSSYIERKSQGITVSMCLPPPP